MNDKILIIKFQYNFIEINNISKCIEKSLEEYIKNMWYYYNDSNYDYLKKDIDVDFGFFL